MFLRNVDIHLTDIWIITEKAIIQRNGHIEHINISHAFSPRQLPLAYLIFIIGLRRQKIKHSLIMDMLLQNAFFQQHFQTF